MRRGSALMAVAGLVGLVGCSEQPGLSPDRSGGGTTPLRLSVHCTAQVVAAPTITCDPIGVARPAAGGTLVIGGQGTYVLLASSGTSYNSSTQIFQSNVTVQNRSAQPLGSTDGNFVDSDGVRVFFVSSPTTTSGSGTVTVNNPDAVGNITGPNQPMFVYPELLKGGQTSAPRPWRFNVPTSVATFTFQVQVVANIPQQAGVLLWRPDGARLNGVSCLSASSCFAVGDVGTIRAWNGSAWLWSATGTTQDLNAVASFSSNAALAVGSNGTALRWNGSYWKELATGTSSNLHGVWCAAATDCFIAGDGGLVLRWNGSSFSTLNTLGVTDNLLAVWGVSATDVRVAGANGRVLRWGGSSFSNQSPSTTADLTAIWGAAGNDVYAVGTGGAIWHWTTSWAQQTSGTSRDLNGVWGFSGANVFAIGANGTVLRKTGVSWTDITITVGATQTLVSVSGGGTTLLLVGAGGTIINSATAGVGFTKTASGTDNNLNGVWGTSASNVYAVGDGGTILRWDGSTVSPVASGTTARLNGIWGSSATNIYAVGDGGVIRRWDGISWTTVTGGGGNDLLAVWGSSASDIYAVGKAGTVRHSTGAAFSAVGGVDATMGGVIRNINAIWGTASNNVYAVGDTGLILHFTSSWAKQPYETGFPQNRDLHGIWGTGPTDIWAVAKHTVLLHNNAVIDPTHYDPFNPNAVYSGPWDHIEVDGTLDNFSVFGVGPGDVFSVGDSGLVLHQNNPDIESGGTGAHWSRMSSLTLDRKLRGVWAASTTDVFIVGDRGLFFRGSR